MHRILENCRVEVSAWGGRDRVRCDDADVRLEGESIGIAYSDEDGMVLFEGRSDGVGGWVLAARSRPWRAWLGPDASEKGAYQGQIEENDEKVQWRLRLSGSSAEPSPEPVRREQ